MRPPLSTLSRSKLSGASRNNEGAFAAHPGHLPVRRRPACTSKPRACPPRCLALDGQWRTSIDPTPTRSVLRHRVLAGSFEVPPPAGVRGSKAPPNPTVFSMVDCKPVLLVGTGVRREMVVEQPCGDSAMLPSASMKSAPRSPSPAQARAKSQRLPRSCKRAQRVEIDSSSLAATRGAIGSKIWHKATSATST